MNLKSRIATLAGDIWISWRCFALWSYPAIVVGTPESKLTGSDFREMLKKIAPGDFILERGDLFKLSNCGIPEDLTYLKHLAIYIGSVDGFRNGEFIEDAKPGFQYKDCIIHAISEGIVCQDVLSLFKHADEIVVVRPWKNHIEKELIIYEAFKNLGASYDFSFKKGNKALYCTELGAKCLKTAHIALPRMEKTRNTFLGLIFPFERFKDYVYVADNFVKMYQIIFRSGSVR